MDRIRIVVRVFSAPVGREASEDWHSDSIDLAVPATIVPDVRETVQRLVNELVGLVADDIYGERVQRSIDEEG